jgi:Domain of unknown function (DUF1906)
MLQFSLGSLLVVSLLLGPRSSFAQSGNAKAPSSTPVSATYLGFDSNDYPGEAKLAALKATFSFAGYWLNTPPGEQTDSWLGKRDALQQRGFGFLILFNGRLDRQLKSEDRAETLGKRDGADAANAALREGFAKGGTIFLDQEEGGRLLPEQNAYLLAWIDAVIAAGFKAGVYCSGIASADGPGKTITTADDIRANRGSREIAFFVYEDACPPSPGCVNVANPPPPSDSGVAYATLWQFAQSPRRPQYARACRSTYARDGNCYPPAGSAASSVFLDLNSALSPDPSNGRR